MPRFFEREMDFRRAMRYPPFVGLVNVIVRAWRVPRTAAAQGGAAGGHAIRRDASPRRHPGAAPRVSIDVDALSML
jgi:hypothetical protein